MNPLLKFILKLASSPKIDMQEDYGWIRKAQSLFSKRSQHKYDFVDKEIYSLDGQHEIPVRIFEPKEKRFSESIIYIHGGGWVIGNIDTYTSTCANISNELGRTLYSIDYRLAPEHPYPQGLNDCLQAVLFLQSYLDNKWILMGDSAGGNLCSAISLKLRDNQLKAPHKQVLIYPVTYWDHTRTSPFRSIIRNGYDYGLTIKKISEYMEMYEPDEDKRKSPYIAPLMATDLSHQPDTLILSAEFDPLRDEGEAYGHALKDAGNKVLIERIKDSVHGFITYPPYVEPTHKAFEIMRGFLD